MATPCLIFFRAGHARCAGSCTGETHRGRAVGRSMASSAHVAIARCAGSCTGETHRGRAVGRSMASSAHVAWLARKKMRHHRPEVATFRWCQPCLSGCGDSSHDPGSRPLPFWLRGFIPWSWVTSSVFLAAGIHPMTRPMRPNPQRRCRSLGPWDKIDGFTG